MEVRIFPRAQRLAGGDVDGVDGVDGDLSTHHQPPGRVTARDKTEPVALRLCQATAPRALKER